MIEKSTNGVLKKVERVVFKYIYIYYNKVSKTFDIFGAQHFNKIPFCLYFWNSSISNFSKLFKLIFWKHFFKYLLVIAYIIYDWNAFMVL